MEQEYTSVFTEEERAARRAQRAEARRQRLRERRRRQLLHLLPVLALLLTGAIGLTAWTLLRAPEEPASEPEPPQAVQSPEDVEPEVPALPYSAAETAATAHLGEELPSTYAVVIDLSQGAVLAEKDAWTPINPASMTKILTLLVAAEQVTDLEDTFTMTIDITDYCYVNGCSVMGLAVGETVSIRELLYGTILPSGADAALALATYVAGSQEDFVALMNEKLTELGLSDTAHFTNCVGLYAPDHTCTVYDMAMILKAAMDNPLCREVLGSRTYETAPTADHEDGQLLSNWFLRRIEDKLDPEVFQVIGAKTGYVTQSGNCAASFGLDADGNEYICVTGHAGSSWQAIRDHVTLYETYCHGKAENA